MSWASEAQARGATIILPLDEATGALDNLASTTDASVTQGSPLRAELPLAVDSAASLKFTAAAQSIDTGITTTNMVDCSVEFMLKTTAASGLILYSRGTGPGIRLGLGAAPVGGGANGGLYYGINGDSIWWGVSTDLLVNDGNIHHIVCVWNGTSGVAVGAGQFTIFVDEVPVVTQNRTYNSATPPFSAMGTWRLGVGEAPAGTWLDNLAVYPNVVLDQAAVTALRAAQLTASTAPTAAPTARKRSVSNALKMEWTRVPYAQSYEYRVDGGTPTSAGTGLSTVVAGTNGVSMTVEIRGVNSVGPGPWSAPVTGTPAPLTYESAIADLSVVPSGYWPCQEEGGTTLAEAGYLAGDAILNGGAVPNGKTDPAAPAGVGRSVHLDGSNDYIALPEGSTWFTPAAKGFTFSCWAYIRSSANSWARLIDFGNAPSFSDILMTPRGNAGVAAMEITGTSATGTSAPSGQWALLSLRVSETGIQSHRINKSPWFSGSGNAPVDRVRSQMWIGRSAYPADPYWAASVSRILTWNDDVTDADLDSLYDAGVEPPTAPTTGRVLTGVGINTSAVLNWAADPAVAGISPSYEYRIDSGAPINVGNVTQATITGLTNGTTYSIEMRGLNSHGPGPWGPALSVTAGSALHYDDFNRPDSTNTVGTPIQGGPYTVRAGTWGINGNALYTSANTAESMLTFPGAVNFDATINLKTPGGNCGFMFRWVDANNTWLAQMNSADLTLWHRRAGTWEEHSRFGGSAASGDVFRVCALGDRIWTFRNGQLIHVVRDQWFSAATATMGIRKSSSTGSRVDAITVQALAAPPFPNYVGDAPDVIADSNPTLVQSFIYKGRDFKVADEGALT